MKKVDCILIPGGGLLEDGSLPPWTLARIDRALALKDQCRWIAFLSGGTVHKPPPLDHNGYPIFESRQAASYLVEAGLVANKILTEISSYDTIGNAYFSRILFSVPFKFKKLHIITSDFHFPRTKTIFEWIYNLTPLPVDFKLSFESVTNQGLSPQALAARVQREENSLQKLNLTRQGITTIDDFQTWIYTEHKAYAVHNKKENLSEDELKSY